MESQPVYHLVWRLGYSLCIFIIGLIYLLRQLDALNTVLQALTVCRAMSMILLTIHFVASVGLCRSLSRQQSWICCSAIGKHCVVTVV